MTSHALRLHGRDDHAPLFALPRGGDFFPTHWGLRVDTARLIRELGLVSFAGFTRWDFDPSARMKP
jgi:hypothetical protein